MTAPVPCRQCGEPVPHDREEWATPMCHACLPPIGAKRAASVLALGRTAMVALLASERPSPHPEGSSAEPAVALPSAYIVDFSALFGNPGKQP